MVKKKNAGRYSKRKSKKRSAKAVARVLGKPYPAKRAPGKKRAKSRKTNPAKPLKRVNKSTGWLKASAVKFKKVGKQMQVLIRRKPATKRRKR